VGERPKHVEL